MKKWTESRVIHLIESKQADKQTYSEKILKPCTNFILWICRKKQGEQAYNYWREKEETPRRNKGKKVKLRLVNQKSKCNMGLRNHIGCSAVWQIDWRQKINTWEIINRGKIQPHMIMNETEWKGSIEDQGKLEVKRTEGVGALAISAGHVSWWKTWGY